MNREGLLSRLEREWLAFSESFEGLSESTLEEPGVVGLWSVWDVLGHIATWEDEALKALSQILQGKRNPYGDIDAFNAQEQERKRDFSLDQIKKDLEATHERVVAFLAGAPESAYVRENSFRRRLRLDTYNHYREHAAQIAERRTSRGL